MTSVEAGCEAAVVNVGGLAGLRCEAVTQRQCDLCRSWWGGLKFSQCWGSGFSWLPLITCDCFDLYEGLC